MLKRCAFVASLVLFTGIAAAQELLPHPWPQENHDARRTAWATVMGPQSNEILREYSVGAPFSVGPPIALRDGNVYLSLSYCIKEDPEEGCLLCLLYDRSPSTARCVPLPFA